MSLDVSSLLPTMVAAAASAWIVGWLKTKAANYKPIGIAETSGEIRLHQTIAWFTIIIGLLLFNFGILGLVYIDDFVVYGVAVSVMGLLISIPMMPSLTQRQNLKWNDETVSGPSKVYWQIMGISRTTIKWSLIESIGLRSGPYYFIETASDNRVYWSKAYKGFEVFEASLREKRPDLIWPEAQSV